MWLPNASQSIYCLFLCQSLQIHLFFRYSHLCMTSLLSFKTFNFLCKIDILHSFTQFCTGSISHVAVVSTVDDTCQILSWEHRINTCCCHDISGPENRKRAAVYHLTILWFLVWHIKAPSSSYSSYDVLLDPSCCHLTGKQGMDEVVKKENKVQEEEEENMRRILHKKRKMTKMKHHHFILRSSKLPDNNVMWDLPHLFSYTTWFFSPVWVLPLKLIDHCAERLTLLLEYCLYCIDFVSRSVSQAGFPWALPWYESIATAVFIFHSWVSLLSSFLLCPLYC